MMGDSLIIIPFARSVPSILREQSILAVAAL